LGAFLSEFLGTQGFFLLGVYFHQVVIKLKNFKIYADYNASAFVMCRFLTTQFRREKDAIS